MPAGAAWRVQVAWLLACLLLALASLGLAAWLYAQPRSTALPSDLPPVMLPLHGTYARERFADRPDGFRWTNGAALAELPNPGGQPLVTLLLAGGPGRSLPLTMTLDERQVASFIVAAEPRRYQVVLPPGSGRRLKLGLNTPLLRGAEGRALGVALGDMALAGMGKPPTLLLITLVLAGCGLLALLAQAGFGLTAASLVTLAIQALILVWQARWGWRYGLAEPLLALLGLGGLAAVAVERWLLPMPPEPIPFPQLRRDPWAKRAQDGGLITFPTGGQRRWWSWGERMGQAWLLLAALLLLALAVRLPWLFAPDPVGDMELSARRMAKLARDGLAGAYSDDGDYMPLRLYLLLLMSKVAPLLGASFYAPLPPATMLLLKLPALLGDAITSAIIFFWGMRRGSLLGAVALAALYALTPPVWINVAWWGQVDGLLMLPMLGAVLLVGSGRSGWGWAAWALAMLIKPQPVLLLPLMLAVTLRRRGSRGLLLGGLVAGCLIVVGMLPLSLAGQGPGMYQAYAGSVGRFPLLTNDAYNLWYLVAGGRQVFDSGQGPGGISYRLIGLLLLGLVALAVAITLLRRADASLAVHGAAVLALAFFCLPTQIHQRYLFLVFAFLALRLASAEGLTPLYLLLVLTGSLNIFGSLDFIPWLRPLIAASPLGFICAVLNLVSLGALLWSLLRRGAGRYREKVTDSG